MMHRLAFLPAAALAVAALAPATAQSQAAPWPAKTVRILVGSPPGGPSDIVTRLYADKLGQRTRQSVVAENRPGVANSLAAGLVAKADPDGYTLVLSPDTVVTVNPIIYPKLNHDPRTELMNVSVLATFTQMLVCNAGKGIRSAQDLVDKARSGRMTYASGGPGSPGHLVTEMMLASVGVRMEHIPYRGPAPATTAVLGGEVDCGFLATPTVLPHVKSGKLVALAVSSMQPSPLAPEVPGLAKALNRPDLDISFSLVLQAPRGTPAAVISELERASKDIMAQPDIVARLQAADLTPVGSTHAEAEARIKAETARWTPLVRKLDLKLE